MHIIFLVNFECFVVNYFRFMSTRDVVVLALLEPSFTKTI